MDEELQQFRQTIGACKICGQPRVAYRVKKQGRNHGRIFVKCPADGTDHKDWYWKEDFEKEDTNTSVAAKPKFDADLEYYKHFAPKCGCGRQYVFSRKKGVVIARCRQCNIEIVGEKLA